MRCFGFLSVGLVGVVLSSTSAGPAFSQATEQQEGTGTVTGRVFCDDTNAPARFASVMLEPVSDVSRAVEGAGRPRSSVTGQQPVLNTVNSTQTGMDGSFTVGNLKPGVYYVGAELPGYLSAVSGFSGDGWVHPSASVADHMAKELQRVTVEAGRTAVVNLTLERGASVNGTVSFSDGTPAAGVSVKILLEKSDGSWEPVGMQAPGRYLGAGVTATNDLGEYRIAGLSAGRYVIEVDLTISHSQMTGSVNGSSGSSSSGGFWLSIFSGGKLKANKDAAFALTAGESRPGEDLVIPKLHTVSGVLVAAADGRALVGSLRLLDSDGKTPVTDANASGPDGAFRFEGVPEGIFVLMTNAMDPQAIAANRDAITKDPGSARVYGMVQQSLDVSADIDGLVISVPANDMPVSALNGTAKNQ